MSERLTKRVYRKQALREAGSQYGTNPNCYWYPTLQFGKEMIENGTMIRFKNRRGVFKFQSMVHNTELDVTWINCFQPSTGHNRAFYLDELKCVVKPKRSRAKKLV
jgi:hypothetical protein